MTTNPNTIPDDIRAAALMLASDIRHHLATSRQELIHHDPVVDDMIAKAIHDAVMVERERWSPASIYFERYCQDEADSAENCITEQQHTDAKAFAAAVRGEG